MAKAKLSKKWYTSKLVWVGIVQTVIASLDIILTWLNSTELSAEGAIGVVAGIAIIWLRFLTKTSVH